MSAFTAHLGMSLRLHFRNRMALLYGYLFPVIFLIAFYVLYRHERVPLLRHMGELLTVAVLGGAFNRMRRSLEKAMQMMRTRLYEEQVRKQEDEISRHRKSLVSSGDRSAKIRTYNFPQGRVTDHRIGMTLYNLQDVLNGNIGELIDALQFAENASKLSQ